MALAHGPSQQPSRLMANTCRSSHRRRRTNSKKKVPKLAPLSPIYILRIFKERRQQQQQQLKRRAWKPERKRGNQIPWHALSTSEWASERARWALSNLNCIPLFSLCYRTEFCHSASLPSHHITELLLPNLILTPNTAREKRQAADRQRETLCYTNTDILLCSPLIIQCRDQQDWCCWWKKGGKVCKGQRWKERKSGSSNSGSLYNNEMIM